MQKATQMTATKRLVLTAVNIALCLVLPMAFHSIPNGGKIMLPMHIPVLLCGMVCGAPYGAACGLLGPMLSSVLTGMPTAALMPAMMVECAAYGLTTGLMLRLVRTGKTYADLYLSLVAAMLVGRLVSGVTKALFFMAGQYTMQAWIAASFVTALPAAVSTQPCTNELPIVFSETSCPVSSRTPVSTTALTTPPITTFPTHANSEPRKCPVGSM